MTSRFLSVAFALSLLTSPLYAHAWGAEGHRITGLVAYQLLTPQAKTAVRNLLGNDDLAEAALYMDEHRGQMLYTASWHYDNLPVCGQEANNCKNGNCASGAITKYTQVLASANASREEKQFALYVLVHMIGDIHQPLHTADDHDKGGNTVKVSLGGRYNTNLHSAWDGTLVKQAIRGYSEADYASQLLKTYSQTIPTWQSGRLNNWIAESHQIAVTTTYGRLPGGASCPSTPRTSVLTLDQNYQNDALQVIPVQLAKAGSRMAMVLNSIFANYRG